MGAPACYAGPSEKRRIQLRRKSQQPKHGRGVKIDVGAQLFLPFHHLFERLANRHPILFPCTFPKVARDLAHRRHSGITFFVNAMTESHDFVFRPQLLINHASARSGVSISSSIFIDSSLAPPCSGPFSVATAEVTAAYMSARVDAVTRAANVDALNSWSA